jgi:hypothetical protein
MGVIAVIGALLVLSIVGWIMRFRRPPQTLVDELLWPLSYWFRRTPKLPKGMIVLQSPPVGDDGAPKWTEEIEAATARFGPEFRAAAIHEVAPGLTLCILLARAVYSTEARPYVGRAILIQEQDDSFRSNVYVTAPTATTGLYHYPRYSYVYSAPISEEDAKDIQHIIRLLCERSHTEIVANKVSDHSTEADEPSGDLDPIGELRERMEQTETLFSAPYDPELWKIAEQHKGHIDMKSVNDEYNRLIIAKYKRL